MWLPVAYFLNKQTIEFESYLDIVSDIFVFQLFGEFRFVRFDHMASDKHNLLTQNIPLLQICLHLLYFLAFH